ncbi:hypothetical protein ISN44_As13g027900 [Arabidopsis suecica]|uniref:NYN domain-containing protein n=1 Tax=Arabidopsis suecica TaxID=45249 RepID=A0A8T1Y456_ARASU|nr:hypothetical protein ISN44_As13g027900 [Arabidopsis suecica]
MDSSTFDRGWGFDSGLSKIWAVVDDNIPKTLTDIYRSAGISMTLVPQARRLLDKCVGVPVDKTNKCVDEIPVDKSNNCVDEIPVDKSNYKHGYRGQRRRRLSSGVSKFVNSSAENMFSNISQSKFAGKDTDIFWDLKDSSILYEHDPVLIYRSIKSALWEKGYQGHWHILAFFVGDGNALSKDLIDKYMVNLIRPIPLPKGNECAIVQVMILRILDWALRTCGRPSNLFILSSNNIKEEKQVASVVQALREKGNYNIVFQDPARLLHQCLVGVSKWVNTHGLPEPAHDFSGFG